MSDIKGSFFDRLDHLREERLDELSSRKLTQYIGKAATSLRDTAEKRGYAQAPYFQKIHDRKASNRVAGIQRATKALDVIIKSAADVNKVAKDKAGKLPPEKFIELYQEMYRVCQEGNMGDPFSYARSREIYIAGVLGHHVADTYSGADGVMPDGTEVEYKSTINKTINGTYNGISVQPTLEKQKEYIRKQKIGKYKYHYMARFDGPFIAEMYELDAKDVLNILMPKIEKEWKKKHSKNNRAADPRIGVRLTRAEIYQYGRKINLASQFRMK